MIKICRDHALPGQDEKHSFHAYKRNVINMRDIHTWQDHCGVAMLGHVGTHENSSKYWEKVIIYNQVEGMKLVS